jgi:hypothetical protein
MSYYKDIYNDFPLRCGRLWRKLRKQAEREKLDVTFMLMTAAAGLAAPYEHIKENALKNGDQHRPPAFPEGNDKHYEKVLKTVKKAIERDLPKSEVFGHLPIEKWKLRTLVNLNDIVGYLESPNQSIGHPFPIRTALDLIRVFRNALAHNNIHAFNRSGAAEIDEIAFFREDRSGPYNTVTRQRDILGYNVISLPHTDFAAFLDAWFTLLQEVGKDKEHLRKVLRFVAQEEGEEQIYANE